MYNHGSLAPVIHGITYCVNWLKNCSLTKWEVLMHTKTFALLYKSMWNILFIALHFWASWLKKTLYTSVESPKTRKLTQYLKMKVALLSEAAYLHNYFNLHICPSLWRQLASVSCPIPSQFTNSAAGSQNVTNKSCLVCVQSEKYAF